MKKLTLLVTFLVFGWVANATKSNQSIFDFSKIIRVDDILHVIRSNRTDCQQIARLFLARIRLYNARIGAVTVLNHRGALSDARRLDAYRKRVNGRLFGRLHCVPTLVKDNILVAGLPTTLGLWAFVNATARVDAGAVWRLRSEGALVLGKANLAPFSFGLKSPDEPSEIGGQCRSPYSIAKGRIGTVYGSSCGNAVGQAARLAVIGLGTDTAGSATWPASVCGLVGIRPPGKTYGADGIFPLLKHAGDTVAPIAFTVADAALVLDIISTSNRTSRTFLSQFSPRRPNGQPFRIGLVRELVYAPPGSVTNLTRVDGKPYEYRLDEEIFKATEHFITRMRQATVTVVNLTITLAEFTDQIHQIHRAWSDVFACAPQWIDAFFKRYPFRGKAGTVQKEIRSLDDMLNVDGIPAHYRRFFQLFVEHKAHCTASVRRLRKVRTAAKRLLQKRIFDLDDVDVIAFPRPHRLRNYATVADMLFMLDPAGALAFPAMTLPIGFALDGPKPSKRDHHRHNKVSPIGLYMMTRPRKFKAMLDTARIYEQSVSTQMTQSHLPPEFV